MSDEEWGNLGDFDANDPRASQRANNKLRTNTKEWQEVIANRKKPTQTEEERLRKSKLRSEMNNSEFHKKTMQELYQSNDWIQSVKKANSNPERNKKISKAMKGKTLSEERKLWISKNSTKTAPKRIESMAKNKGYIITPLGKFLTVRYAWQAHCKQDPNTTKNPHNWFKKMCKDYPNDYYRKSP